jgi:hypothetical protein
LLNTLSGSSECRTPYRILLRYLDIAILTIFFKKVENSVQGMSQKPLLLLPSALADGEEAKRRALAAFICLKMRLKP